MKTYLVAISTEYEVEAKSKEEAEDKAEEKFAEDVDRGHFGITEILTFEAKELK